MLEKVCENCEHFCLFGSDPETIKIGSMGECKKNAPCYLGPGKKGVWPVVFKSTIGCGEFSTKGATVKIGKIPNVNMYNDENTKAYLTKLWKEIQTFKKNTGDCKGNGTDEIAFNNGLVVASNLVAIYGVNWDDIKPEDVNPTKPVPVKKDPEYIKDGRLNTALYKEERYDDSILNIIYAINQIIDWSYNMNHHSDIALSPMKKKEV